MAAITIIQPLVGFVVSYVHHHTLFISSSSSTLSLHLLLTSFSLEAEMDEAGSDIRTPASELL